ncbi:hypothetical protein C8F01DRAFT_986790, partial [Mycena amicta]
MESDPEKRPPWAVIARHRLSKHIVGADIRDDTQRDLFLQTWHPNQSKVPGHLRPMMKVVQKYGVEFETIDPPAEISEALPLWHHFGKRLDRNQINNGETQRCLRQYHGVQTVQDGLRMLERLDSEDHSPHRSCQCTDCNHDRHTHKCSNPHACAKAVETCISQILPKWDPRKAREPDNEPDGDVDENEGVVKFKPPRQITQLRDGFRVLTKDGRDEPAPRPCRRRRGQPAIENTVVAYISGVIKTPKRKATRAGAGIFLENNHEGNKSLRIPPHWSQNVRMAEAAAALLVVRNAPD